MSHTVVAVETVPGLLSAIEAWSAHGRQILEGASSLGVTGPVIGSMVAAVDQSGAAAREVRAQLAPLIEAASAVQGADGVTVAAARQG